MQPPRALRRRHASKQNKYGEPQFFESYSAMPRSVGGLQEAGEWPPFRSLLPELRGKRVLDIGCGFGWQKAA